MASIQFNFTKLKNVYMEALSSYDKSVAFDIRIASCIIQSVESK